METTTPTAKPFLTTREQAPSYWLVDSLWTVLATADTTDGALTVLDQLMPRRSGPPPHVHERLQEYFYLLEGEIRFQLGTEVQTARTGSLLSVPSNTVHAFAVVSETARVLNLYTPAGFTEQISYIAAPATELRLPRDGEQRPPPRTSRTPTSPEPQSSTPNAGSPPTRPTTSSPTSGTPRGPRDARAPPATSASGPLATRPEQGEHDDRDRSRRRDRHRSHR